MKNSKKTDKVFDCVASKRKAQARIYRRIAGKTVDQEVAYFDKSTAEGPFGEMWNRLVAEGRKASKSGRLPHTNRQSA